MEAIYRRFRNQQVLYGLRHGWNLDSQAASRPGNQRKHCHYYQLFHSHYPHQLILLCPFQVQQCIHLIAHLLQRYIAAFEPLTNFPRHRLMCEENLRCCSVKEVGGCDIYSDGYSRHQMVPCSVSDQVTLSHMSHR